MFKKLRIINARKTKIAKPKLSLKEVNDLIDLKVTNWSNNLGTNCLAFALGLDIPYWDVASYIIYNCGGFYSTYTKRPKNIDNLTHVEKLELDFDTLGILYEQIDLKDKITDPNEWKIAFFDTTDNFDFHFFREKEDGIWYHKCGICYLPSKLDSCGNITLDPIEYMKINYSKFHQGMEYQKTYRLRKSR